LAALASIFDAVAAKEDILSATVARTYQEDTAHGAIMNRRHLLWKNQWELKQDFFFKEVNC
jgi:hypothetical protein